jgi:predicted aspartyl protease
VGKVLASITITNRADETLAERGFIQRIDVRSLTLDDVLVDTGATTLCLPQPVIDALGLGVLRQIVVRTASGVDSMPLYEDAKITVMGRTGTFECLALAEGNEALLGVIPLEMLGLEPDLQNQRLRVLPDQGRQTYMLAPSPITY